MSELEDEVKLLAQEDEAYEHQKKVWEEEAKQLAKVKQLASRCPHCGKELGEPDFEDEDPSVGIFGVSYGNECPVHGLFWYDELGHYYWEQED